MSAPAVTDPVAEAARYTADHMTFDPPPSGSFPQAPAAPSLLGQVLADRYRIVKKLGEGGMGEVYAAEHVHIDKKFAVKLLKAEIVSNAEAVKRFQQEARSSSSIKHRNIIAVDDFGQLPDGRIFMCMELLEGAALNDLIQQPMPADRLLNILIQAGHGLAAAHAKGIVHRDMKPENIFVTFDQSGDIPKLLDFGIAKVAGNDGQNNLTRTGTIFGTPFYMAPEQALGNPVDARTDVYAMGVIMYECFAGSLPFQSESFMGILTQHITKEPEPVAQRAAAAGRALPMGLAEIITRCMQKDPGQRYQTMDELVNALIGVYRTIAGPGMSTYMEAFPVGSAQHLVQPTPMPAGGMAPTYVPPGSSQPVMIPQYGVPGVHGGMPSGPSAVLGASASSVTPALPRKSKLPLILAIAVIVATGGGIAAVLLLKKDSGGGAGSGSQQVASGDSGSGSAVVATPGSNAGSGKDPWAGSGSAGSAGSAATGSGSANQGSAVQTPAGSGSAQTPEVKTIEVAVFTSPYVDEFEIWENGKKLQSGSEDLQITPGQSRTIIVKAKGFKDSKPVAVTGKKSRVRVNLTPIQGHKVDKPPQPTPGLDCSSAIKDNTNKKCIQQFCAAHSDDPRCDAE